MSIGPGARFNAGSFQSGADLAVEQDAPLVDHLTQPSIQASASAHIANQLTQLLVEVCQHPVIGMPKVDGEGGLARHLVETTWAGRDAANRRHGRRAHASGETLGTDHDLGRPGQRVVPPSHGHRARVAGDSLQSDTEYAHSDHPVDNSDLVPRLNEDWALLDMGFYECVQILPSRAQDCPRI